MSSSIDFMINKDLPDMQNDEAETKQISYNPRINSGTGKKRGAILSWALPANRM